MSSFTPLKNVSSALNAASFFNDRNNYGRTVYKTAGPITDQKLSRFNPLESTMADPFEVRMRFTNQLQHLNASVTSSQKAAQYALKYKDMDEDLHSCILEQVEKVKTPPCRPRAPSKTPPLTPTPRRTQ